MQSKQASIYGLTKKSFYLVLISCGVIANAAETPNNQTPPANYPQLIKPKNKLFTPASKVPTKTPIKHIVVLFQENISFDRYFGVYPNAKNPTGEPQFIAKPNTPAVNGLTKELIDNNPNSVKPYRLERNLHPCSNEHEYLAEIASFNGGLMNKFVEETNSKEKGCAGQVMGYYDGNSVTALWNYAQNYALNDNTYTSNFGPSTPGAMNLTSGTTGPSVSTTKDTDYLINGYIVSDPNPYYDDCSSATSVSGSATEPQAMRTSGKNIGELLNAKNITWGWFQGGFTPTAYLENGSAVCDATSTSIYNVKSRDYIPHHEPFNYFATTANPHHLPPTSNKYIGSTDQANHQYDLTSFWQAVKHGNLPAVTYLKPRGFEDGHAGYSDPLDEQRYLVTTINKLQQLPEWKNMAIVIIYDDTDGDYDHQLPPKNQTEVLNGHRGFGGRVPMLLISPWSKVNYVDHTQLDQSSISKFIEYNWGQPPLGVDTADNYAGSILNMFDFKHKNANQLILDPTTGVERID